MELHEAIQECWQTAEDHGFHGVGRTFGDATALIHSEVSEAFEAYREKGRHLFYTEVDGKPEGTASELADTVIRCFDTAVYDLGLDSATFATIIEQKMAYNKQRPFMHGKTM